MIQIKEIGECRACGGALFHQLFDLGMQAIIKFKNSPDETDDFSPLSIFMCATCNLVQLRHSVEQDRMFRNYHYLSGVNASMRASLCDIVKHVENIVDITEDDVVVDIGSNDGTLLQCYMSYVCKVGFEPAKNIRSPPNVETIQEYFSASRYNDLFMVKAKVITAIAMFYDLEDPNQFCADVKKILHPDGVFIIQMNYLGAMIKNLTLDNISHEHLCYYSFKTLHQILEKNGLVIQSVVFNDVNGGSMRVVCAHKQGLIKEAFFGPRESHLEEMATYVDFARQLNDIKQQIQTYVRQELDAGKTVWGYGASTRGNTLLQWLNFDSKVITSIADRNPLKHGKFTAGGNIPICSEEEMRKAQPDNLLVLPYHFRKEFLEREKEYLEKGGKMIFPLRNFKIYSKDQIDIKMNKKS